HRPDGARFVDPAALAIAVDAHGRKIAHPVQRGESEEVLPEMPQHHVAFEVRWDADQHVRCACEQAAHLLGGRLALERGKPCPKGGWAFLKARSGPCKGGRARAQAARQGLRRVSKAEAEKPHRHASSPTGNGSARAPPKFMRRAPRGPPFAPIALTS